jgi:type IV pilus assembly protein PilZ
MGLAGNGSRRWSRGAEAGTLSSVSRDRGRPKPEPIRLSVTYERMNAFFAEYEKNIRRGGTFIPTEKPLPIGTDFTFELTVPKRSAPFVLFGRVQSIVTKEQASPAEDAGMRIAFVHGNDDERARFTASVEALLVESFGQPLVARLFGAPAG